MGLTPFPRATVPLFSSSDDVLQIIFFFSILILICSVLLVFRTLKLLTELLFDKFQVVAWLVFDSQNPDRVLERLHIVDE